MENNNITPKKDLKSRLLESDTYEIIRPYNVDKEIFNTDRFDVKIIKDGDSKLVIIRKRSEKIN